MEIPAKKHPKTSSKVAQLALSSKFALSTVINRYLQCFDTVGGVAGRASAKNCKN